MVLGDEAAPAPAADVSPAVKSALARAVAASLPMRSLVAAQKSFVDRIFGNINRGLLVAGGVAAVIGGVMYFGRRRKRR